MLAADWPTRLSLVGAYLTRKIVICSVEVGVDYCSVVVLCFGGAQ